MESAALVAVFIDGESYAGVESDQLCQNECCERLPSLFPFASEMLGVVRLYFYGTLEHKVAWLSVSIWINLYQSVLIFMSSGVFESYPYQWTYVGLFVSSDGFDIYGYPVFLDVIRDIFVDADVFIVFYGMEIHIYRYHSYDHFHQHCFHSNLYGYWCVYGFRRAVILYNPLMYLLVRI